MNQILRALLWLSCWMAAGWPAAAAPFHDVTKYGAKGDGKTLATAAIQRAVDVCASKGGGTVVVPAGRYLTGPIFLRSRVHLELEPGAVLLGSTNFNDYPVIHGRWEGIERRVYASLLTGEHLDHVSVTGAGMIDGQGAPWWEAHRRTAKLRQQQGLPGREPENPVGAPLAWPRPRMINLYFCTNVIIRDLTIVNSPSWTIHPVYCENMLIDNVTITNPADSPNTDAVDPDSCRDLRICNGHFDVGDDCIVIKSGYNEDGRRVGMPCEDILVNNCAFFHGHGGVVIGSEMSGSVRNVAVANCLFDGTQRGLRVKTSLGRGGVIENFRASNLVMRHISDAAFSITAAYDPERREGAPAPGPEAIPAMRHIHWSDAIVVDAHRVADLSGLAEAPLEDFSLRNVQATSAALGIHCANARNVVLGGLDLQVASGACVEVQNASQVDILGLAVARANAEAPLVVFEKVSGAWVHGCEIVEGPGALLQLNGDANHGITVEGNRLAAGALEQEPGRP
jgi:hypothetical protein